MERIVRLTESDLNRLVKKIIKESKDFPISVQNPNIIVDGKKFKASSKGFNIPIISINQSMINQGFIKITVDEPYIPFLNDGGQKTHDMSNEKVNNLLNQIRSGVKNPRFETKNGQTIHLTQV
jgi:hypothetical protein